MSISVHFQDQKNIQPVFGAPAGKAEAKANVFMGDLNLGKDPVNERLNSARKQAFKLVSDAFSSDQEFAKRLDKLKSFAAEQKEERSAATEAKNSALASIEAIKEEYKVDPDSQEQKDLDWLIAYRKAPHDERFADPEQMKKDMERAASIESNLTEYQSRMLEANEQLDAAQKRIDDADILIMEARKSLTDAESEQNKTHAMADARAEADAIIDAAERSVIGMVMNDAKDNMDEKVREEQEKAQEKKEEEKKQEKLEAERAEKKELQEALAKRSQDDVQDVKERSRARQNDDVELSDLLGSDPAQRVDAGGNVNAALDEIKNKMALIDVDLMGIKVDESL